MQNFLFDFKDSGITPAELENFAKELAPEIIRLQRAREQGYDTPYAALNAPFDEPARARVHEVIARKKQLNPAALVLVGIGGSNLGTLAVWNSVVHPSGVRSVEGFGSTKGSTHRGECFCVSKNVSNSQRLLISADTVDTDKLARQLAQVETLLQANKIVLINVITKSGATTETIANFELFFALLKKYHPHNYADYVVVTTDENSAFAQFAQTQKFTVLTIPPKVGGRYSVFTAVGLFPLGMLGVDIDALCAGAQKVSATDPVVSASVKYAYYQQTVNIHDMFLFATDLFSFGLWYRQLMGESVGKELNRSNQKVEVGITPTVSLGTADLHSVGQLYLGGPRDKFTTFVTVAQPATDLVVPHMPEFEQFVPAIQGKKITTIMNAIIGGVQQAYRANKRPFCTMTLQKLNAETMGQLLQFYMIEMMLLGYLFDVNPFDQPNVESYKKETRRLLGPVRPE